MLGGQRTLQAEGAQVQVTAHIPIDVPHSLMHFVQSEFEGKASHPWLFARLSGCCAAAISAVRRKSASVKLLYDFIVNLLSDSKEW